MFKYLLRPELKIENKWFKEIEIDRRKKERKIQMIKDRKSLRSSKKFQSDRRNLQRKSDLPQMSQRFPQRNVFSQMFNKNKLDYFSQNLGGDVSSRKEYVEDSKAKEFKIELYLCNYWRQVGLKFLEEITFVGRFYFCQEENSLRAFVGIDKILDLFGASTFFEDLIFKKDSPETGMKIEDSNINFFVIEPSK